MATTKYSHAFLVGRIATNATCNTLNKNGWEHIIADEKNYADLCNYYYKGHVNAMVECVAQPADLTPPFLTGISHYRLAVQRQALLPLRDYHFLVCNLHLFFFPLNTTLIAIEIDDSGNSLDALTWGHSELMGWRDKYSEFPVWTKKVFEPLADLLETDITQLCADGNKLKLYQIANVPHKDIDDRDALLYELGTSSPIGCVNGNMWLTPAPEYYRHIMTQNSIAAFNGWKALALNDSFTMLDVAEKSPMRETWDDNYKLWLMHYFQLIYLRCFFEKTFCLSRNNAYRQGKAIENLSSDIAEMERYYFYDNISYNFLPNMLYKAMAKGLGIKEEREELTKQIKESAKKIAEDRKEKEEKRRDLILAFVSVFAVFSIIWDLCQIVKDALSIDHNPTPAQTFIAIAILLIAILLLLIYRKKDETK